MNDVCIAFTQTIKETNEVSTYQMDVQKNLAEHRLDVKIAKKYTIVGHGGQFLVLQSIDRAELRLYTIGDGKMSSEHISINEKKLNFAMAR